MNGQNAYILAIDTGVNDEADSRDHRTGGDTTSHTDPRQNQDHSTSTGCNIILYDAIQFVIISQKVMDDIRIMILVVVV